MKEEIEKSNNLVNKQEFEKFLNSSIFSESMVFSTELKAFLTMPLKIAPNDFKKAREDRKSEFDRSSVFKRFSSNNRNSKSDY